MPHSSGGGSHSGGFHSSGSHHSGGGGFHSSGGGSHHSGGGGFHSGGSYGRPPAPRPKPRVQRGFFEGARLYMYHYNHQPVYVYANEAARPKPRQNWLWLIYGPILAIFIFLFVSDLLPMAPLSLDYATDIVVEDGAACLSEQEALTQAMEAFRDSTGVTPAVVTVTNETWQAHYTSLEAYAYDRYVNLFRDEKHWLIVYAQPADANGDAFPDWYWEGMQGDETDEMIDRDCLDAFSTALQSGLTRTDVSVSQALQDAFAQARVAAVRPELQDGMSIIVRLCVIGAILLLALSHTRVLRLGASANTLPPDAVPAQMPADQSACAYCGGIYPLSSLTCPYCGAPRSQTDGKQL